jgi:hypothetical protein
MADISHISCFFRVFSYRFHPDYVPFVKKQGLSLANIPEQVADIDPDDEFVPFVLLFLDLLLDDPEDCCIFPPPGGRR